MLTMKDIAEQAQVSVATVSRVLNNSGYVSIDKRQRVMELVEKLEYEPNSSARDLAGAKSFLLGVILPDISNPFFSDILCEMEEEAYHQGYSLMISNSKGRKNKIREMINTYRARNVDGLLVCIDPRDSSIIAGIQNKHIPVVSFTQRRTDIDSVYVSMKKGGALVAQHFLDLGHETIAFIGEKDDPKFEGFQQHLRSQGVVVKDENMVSIDGWEDLSNDVISERIKDFISHMNQDVSAIFAFNDIAAIHALNALHLKGVEVPGDVILAGYDNIYLTRELDPPLTTVGQPTKEIGRLAIKMLIKRISGESQNPVEELMLEPRLIVRQSTLRI